MRKNQPAGIREVQRDLNLSSPSVANYQIEKLLELGLVGKDMHGRYYLLHKVQIPALKAYVNVGRLMVPRLTFYAGFFTALLAVYLILNLNSLNIFAVAFGSIGTAVFWYETFRFWKMSLVSVHVDLPIMKPFTVQKRNEIIPYLALGIVIIAASTIGFDMLTGLLTEYVQNHPVIYDPNSLDLESINIDSQGPADRISESISLSKQRVNYAMREDAYGPGVPMISEQSLSTLMIVLPFVTAMAAASVLYAVAKIRAREQVLE